MPEYIHSKWGDVEVEILGVKFRPKPGVGYFCDYVQLYKSLKGASKEYQIQKLQSLVLYDLWFLCYFVITKGKPEEDPVMNDPKGWFVKQAREVADLQETYVMDLWGRFHGKAQRHDQEVPTPDGMRLHGDLHEGDRVFGRNGEPVCVIAESPEWKSEDNYRIRFDDGTEVEGNGEHLWFVDYYSKQRQGDWKEDGRVGRTEEVWSTADIFKYSELRNRYPSRGPLAIRLAGAYKCEEKAFPIQPYTLGQWLGDGTTRCGAITSGDKEIWGYIESEGYKISKDRTPQKNCELRTIYGIQPVLRKIGVLGDKHIPELYFWGSYKQRLSLLRGLMDSDGYVHTDNVATFTNIKLRLARDVKRLAESLGYKVFLQERITEYDFDDAYIYYDVRFTCYADMDSPFNLKRKTNKITKNIYCQRKRYIASVEKIPPVPSKCIQVEGDGSYLIGKECTVTHNSLLKTIGKTVQYHLLHPDHCTLILSYKKGAAESFQSSISSVWEDEYMRWLFPMRLYDNPKSEAPSWGIEKGLTIMRENRSRKEKTVQSSGLIEGMATGGHFERLIFDDISTADLANSIDGMNDCFDKFQIALNLAYGSDRDIIDISGTYYHHQDPLVKIGDMQFDDGKPLFKLRRRPSTHNGKRDGKPVFVSEKRMEILKLGADFNTQHLLDPTPQGEQALDGNRLKVIDHQFIPKDGVVCFMLVDPAGDDKDGCDWAIGKVLVKPCFENMALSKWYVVDLAMSPFSHAEALSTLTTIYLRGEYVHQLGIEDDRSMTHKFAASELGAKGRVINETIGNLVLLKHKGRNKDNRIASAWQWPLVNDCCFISSRIPAETISRIKTQLNNFPYGIKDGIDMLAYLPDMINSYRMWPEEQDEDDTRDMVLDTSTANPVTGY